MRSSPLERFQSSSRLQWRGACEAERHDLSALAYDTTQEPLCAVLDANAAVVYQPPMSDLTTTTKAYCACP